MLNKSNINLILKNEIPQTCLISSRNLRPKLFKPYDNISETIFTDKKDYNLQLINKTNRTLNKAYFVLHKYVLRFISYYIKK